MSSPSKVRGAPVLLALALGSVVACGGSPEADEAFAPGTAEGQVGEVQSAIYDGESSYHDEVVMVEVVDWETGSRRESLCTGILLNSRAVLTAAHCLDALYDHRGDYRIRVLAGRVSTSTSTDIYEIAGRTVTGVRPCPGEGTGGHARHPNYNPSVLMNGYDFAVVVADESISGSRAQIEYDAPDPFLPGSFSPNPDGYLMRRSQLVGYGMASSSVDSAGRRRQVDPRSSNGFSVQGLQSTAASSAAGMPFGALQVRSGLVCPGDSGGPLIQITSSGGERYVGILTGAENATSCPSGRGLYSLFKPVKSFIQQFGISSVGGICI